MTTPEKRAAATPGLLENLSETERERVLGGHIAIGDTPETVRIAWGEPDRKTRLVRDTGEAERWIHLAHKSEFVDGFPRHHFGSRYHHPRHGRYVVARRHFGYPDSHIVRRPHAHKVVEFRDGQVAAFEIDAR